MGLITASILLKTFNSRTVANYCHDYVHLLLVTVIKVGLAVQNKRVMTDRRNMTLPVLETSFSHKTATHSKRKSVQKCYLRGDIMGCIVFLCTVSYKGSINLDII